MSRMKQLFAVSGVILLSLTLSTCKPIGFYLEKVYKVYGVVTVDSQDATQSPTPIGSAEVFLKGYQYSELTNYDGAYEMEMAQGAWEIDFVKAGFETLTVPVTVGPDNPRVEVNAALKPLQPPAPASLLGAWQGLFYASVGGPFQVILEFSESTFAEKIVEMSTTFAGTYLLDESAQTFSIVVTSSSNPAMVPVGLTDTAAYSLSADNNTLAITQQSGTAAMSRVVLTPPVFGTWVWPDPIIVDGLTMEHLVMTLNEGGTYAISYDSSGVANQQSGTFDPVDMPADMIITFTVIASSGPPAAPSPGSAWLLKYYNQKALTVDLFLDLFVPGFEGPFLMLRQ